MSTINERIKIIIERYYNGSQRAFAEAIGTSSSVVNGIVGKRKSSPSFEILQKIYATANISADWLLTGDGDILTDNHSQPDSGSLAVDVLPNGSSVEQIYHPKSFERTLDVQDIPLYSFDVTGGILENLDDSAQFIEGTIRIPDAPKCDGAVRVVGNSMTPIINPGDIIAFSILNSLDYLLYGQIYFVDYSADASNNFLVCKIVKKSDRGDDYISLHSANPSHDPVDIPRSSVRHIAIVKLSIHYHMIL